MCSQHYQQSRRRNKGVPEKLRGLCSIGNCNGVHYAKGLCVRHRATVQRRMAGVQEKTRGFCGVTGCPNQHYAKGWCNKHYCLVRKYDCTPEELDFMQNSDLTCLLCFGKSSVVDHCHVDRHKRGFICHYCNTLLGQIESGGLDRVARALQYLDEDKSNPGINWTRQFEEG